VVLQLGGLGEMLQLALLRNRYVCLGLGLILWYHLSNGKGTRKDNIKIDLQEMGWGDMDWIDLAQDRDRWRALVYAVVNLRVP